MKIRLIETLMIDGKACKAGTVVEVSNRDARRLIAAKDAEAYTEPPAKGSK